MRAGTSAGDGRPLDFLDAHSPLDLDALFGVLHAVVVAPGMLPPSGWLPMVVPEGPGTCMGSS